MYFEYIGTVVIITYSTYIYYALHHLINEFMRIPNIDRKE